jgi:putative ABC transport system ATP-binding protein
LSKSYAAANGRIDILDGVSLSLKSAQSASIQGASGCGKSTLLHLVGALDTADNGSIFLRTKNQQNIDINALSETQADNYRRQHIGFVFQKFNLIDCISVIDNISLPSKLNHNIDMHYIDALVKILDISQHLNKLPAQLSGGEQQRVAIARALAHKPSLILADEPTGNLDEANSDTVSELLYKSCKEVGSSLLLVTHSEKVAKLADESFYMHDKKLNINATGAL